MGEGPWTSSWPWATQSICRELRPTELERGAGAWRPTQLRKAYALRKICGLLVFKDFFPVEVLEGVVEALKGHKAVGEKRGSERWEVRLPLEKPFVQEELALKHVWTC